LIANDIHAGVANAKFRGLAPLMEMESAEISTAFDANGG
jgi:hypothetical protein